ncbi:MAG: hypothetical protein K6B75_04060, partial [Lachnospiraceae bacterium]|nr:hypothetical protein [Lachnospiraceae bacterium]
MGTILVAMPRPEDAKHLSQSLIESGNYVDIEVCTTGSEILRVAHERNYGVVVCTRQLRDMSFIELSDYLPEFFGMIVLTKDSSVYVNPEKGVRLMMPFSTVDLLSTI